MATITYGYDIETTGVNPFKDKIITIQFRRSGRNYVYKIWEYGDDEREMILSFLDTWKRIPRAKRMGGDLFVTYNFKFDGPFLLTRCLLTGIDEEEEWREYLWENIIHGPSFIDLYQLLGDELISFAEWRGLLVGSVSRYRGRDIPIFYRSRQYDRIEEYVEDELITLERIYQAIQEEPFYRELSRLREQLRRRSRD